MEERDKREEKHDENFSIYRHQTATVERKKETVAQKLQDARSVRARLPVLLFKVPDKGLQKRNLLEQTVGKVLVL